MLFTYLKIVHVISASLLLGLSLAMGLYVLFANLQHNLTIIIHATRQFIWLNIYVIGIASIIQLITGFLMAYVKGYVLSQFWGIVSFVGYGIAGFCWLPIIFLQMKCHDLAIDAQVCNIALSKIYYQYLIAWVVLGLLAVFSIITVFYFMVYRSI